MKNTHFFAPLTIYQLHAPLQNKASRLGENVAATLKVSCGNGNGKKTSKLSMLFIERLHIKTQAQGENITSFVEEIKKQTNTVISHKPENRYVD